MRIKKVLLVLIALFVLTGCTAKYELTYENDVFSEHIVINEEKINGSLSEFGINRVKTNPNLVKMRRILINIHLLMMKKVKH